MAELDSQHAKLNKEEIVEILERNVELYRHEANFVQYIVELAVYLVEHRMIRDDSAPGPKKKSDAPAQLKTRAEEPVGMKSRKKRGMAGRCRFCGAENATGVDKCTGCGSNLV